MKEGLLVAALAASFAVAGAAGLNHAAHAAGLEIPLARAGAEGPVLTVDSGCFVYGSLVAALNQGRAQGIPIEHYLGLVRQPWASVKVVPGMPEFLARTVRAVYAWPTERGAEPYRAVMQQAIDACRAADGRTGVL